MRCHSSSRRAASTSKGEIDSLDEHLAANEKEIANNKDLAVEERFKATLALAKLPRDSSATRLHNRCLVTGRPRAYYRKFKMSRIALRDLASIGQIPGMVKSSW